ncbi:bifunctional diaminohydroxyphosphoribosylaminopyrimidine deaminase/5-amino-6-(5-phosphoribosylamino)uracil reductase RibD [Alkalimarinus coralli]|uniref:bifunctional diaminohydroxyphosphoribosylaminopyrimidine deaminase/5-amino-6-(5-phosphoribosylamino)uracil reductase RibD n=1 Tax=Alkalimarinus coralli TaxID=2935863 RepID=UPI00202AE6EF|nr:bifunctional diaminohydroxyphosphoribosylaminopyrimidine deaminase/5-amino-6-(5-phosphoribosylamino)uracil reductase RibD [Alkalimarinus coralli]
MNTQDRIYMAEAIQLANKGLYTTEPNPRVGCVIVKDGKIVGRGWHEKAGEAHAEVNALNDAGGDAEGATAYVTLEPCSHFGKTPPCAKALIDAKIKRVVAAMQDPNPLVAGSGFDMLREAGIDVESGLLKSEAEALNPGFVKRMQTGLPLVRVKLGMSVDGRTAMASGESQWITAGPARQDVQRLRARSSAIITGSGTLNSDNPSLTVRAGELGLDNAEEVAKRQPLRVVVDSEGDITSEAKLLQLSGKTVIAMASNKGIDDELGNSDQISFKSFSGESGRVDLKLLLSWLAAQGCNEVLVEAGATLAGAFVAQQLVDELWIYMAPKLMGSKARPLLGLPLDRMSQHIPMTHIDSRVIGDDIRLIYRLEPEL